MNARLKKQAAEEITLKQQRESVRLGARLFRSRRHNSHSSTDNNYSTSKDNSTNKGYSSRHKHKNKSRERLTSTTSGEYPSIGIESEGESCGTGIFRSASISSERSRFSFNIRFGSQSPSIVLDDMDSKSESEKVRNNFLSH